MLALSRKKDEAVIINDDIQIQNANKEAAQSVDIKNIKELFAKK